MSTVARRRNTCDYSHTLIEITRMRISDISAWVGVGLGGETETRTFNFLKDLPLKCCILCDNAPEGCYHYELLAMK